MGAISNKVKLGSLGCQVIGLRIDGEALGSHCSVVGVRIDVCSTSGSTRVVSQVGRGRVASQSSLLWHPMNRVVDHAVDEVTALGPNRKSDLHAPSRLQVGNLEEHSPTIVLNGYTSNLGSLLVVVI
jgi:hypothetical protein